MIVRSRQPERRALLAQALSQVPGLVLLAANDPLLAGRLDGLHLSERRAREAAHWRALRPDWLITVAAHSARALRILHADAALLSPVFFTRSHPQVAPLGAARARMIARNSLLPVIALGGVSPANAGQLRGFAGAAGVSAFL